MSYERALKIWEAQEVEPPAFTAVDGALRQGLDPAMPAPRAVRGARFSLALAMLGFVAMASIDNVRSPQDSGRMFAVVLPLALLVWASLTLETRSLARQMLVRAIAWSSLVIGVMVAAVGLPEFSWCGPPIAVGSGAALLSMGGRGLGITSTVFRPIAFRAQLLVALVLAMADAQTLVFSGLVEVVSYRIPPLPGVPLVTKILFGGQIAVQVLLHPALVSGAVMIVAIAGIVRLRTWALLLNLVANVAIAALALDGTLHVSPPVAIALSLTATVQLLLPVPILAAALGDRNRDRRPLGAWGPRLVRGVIVVMMMAGVMGPLLPASLGFMPQRVGWVQFELPHDVRGARRPGRPTPSPPDRPTDITPRSSPAAPAPGGAR